MSLIHKSNWTVPYTVLYVETDLHNQNLVVQLQKYQNTFFLVIFVSHKLFEMLLHLHTFFNMCHMLTTHSNTEIPMSSIVCIKGTLILLLDKTGYFSQHTRPKFIDSQNFYFHFHCKLFCILLVHLSDKLSLTCTLLWPIEAICIGLYVLKRLMNVWHILEKNVSIQHSFEEFWEKHRRA